MKYEVKCGQILRLIDDKKYYNVGTNGELAIVLSCEDDAWSVGTFWGMRGGNKSCGGARFRELMEYEINEIFELVGHISEIEKG
jgi:hypothetical protein